MWARVTGVLLVDLFLRKNPWPLDPTGMFQLESPPIGQYCDMKIRPEQPFAADFCRVVPGGTGYIAVSKPAAEFFDRLKLKDVIIAARGEGFL
jgi:hypothetical protein